MTEPTPETDALDTGVPPLSDPETDAPPESASAPGSDAPPEPLPAPTLEARGLTLRTKRGTVFAPVDLDLPPDTPLAVLGTQGSGRSALLLALTGRLQGVSGELRLGELDAMRHPHRLREATAVAHITGYVELEPALTVRECVRERTLLDGVKRAAGRERFLDLAEAVGLEAEPGTLVGRLPAVQYTLLTAVLACLRPARLVAYDDIDSSLTDPQLDHVYGALEVLREHGHPFAVSALASSAAPHGAVVLPLSPALEN